MNRQTRQALEARTLEAALQALARTTGLRAEVAAREPRFEPGNDHTTPDAVITLRDDDRAVEYRVEIKAADRFAAIGAIRNQLARHAGPGLLVAPYITPEMAQRCRAIDLQFIDTAGNAYLKAPGLHVLVTGQKRHPAEQLPAMQKANTATAMRILFALMCKPQLLNAPYRQIKDAAGVALGAVGWVFADLAERGHLVGNARDGNRRLVDPRRLLNEWVINYPIRLRPKLGARRFRAATPDWWKKAAVETYGGQWGGEIAADMLVHNREPGHVIAYVQGDPAPLIVKYRLRPDQAGDVEILDRFWNFEVIEAQYNPNVVPPLLVYADLMATQDPRNHETANLVHERYIAPAYDQP